MAKKIFFGNYKGGVGKTTSAYYMSHFMAIEGYKVLVLDLDPQCSLSEICMNSVDDKELEDLETEECLNYIFDMYYKKSTKYKNIDISFNKDKLVKGCSRNHSNVDFIPSNLFYKYGGLDSLAMKIQDSEESIFFLNQFIKSCNFEKEYDFILIDCPPTSNIITQGAFLLSDYYIIPSIMDSVSTKGIVHYINSIIKVYESYCINHEDSELYKNIFGEKPKLIGIFETLHRERVKNSSVIDSLKLEIESMDDIRSEVLKDDYIFDVRIENYIDIARSISKGEIDEIKGKPYLDLTKKVLSVLK